MNRRLAALVVAATAVSAPAHAADIVLPGAAPLISQVSIYDWSGFYLGIGGGTGYILDEVNSTALGGSSVSGLGGQGFFGKVTAGYDYDFGNGFVLGGLAVGRYGDIDTKVSIPSLAASGKLKADWGFDVLARAGYTITPRTLAFVVGGYSYQNFDLTSSLPGVASEWDDSGYTVGFGLETAFRDNLTWSGGYRFSQYSGKNIGALGGIEINPTIHTFHSSLNYRFGGGPSARSQAPVDYDWTGFKIGASIGGGVARNKINTNLGGGSSLDSLITEGFIGNVSVGYDHEIGSRFVAGIQLGAQYLGASSSATVAGVTATTKADDFGFEAVLRAGYKPNEYTMGYVVGGYVYQNLSASLSTPAVSVDKGVNAFTIGTGGELALTERVTGFVEYRYTIYEDIDLSALGATVTLEPTSHTVQVGARIKLY